jgi:hypothetical protein
MIEDREAREVLGAFALPAPLAELARLSGGHINATWRAGACLIQRLNPYVFPDGAGVMGNIVAVTERLEERLGAAQPHLRLFPTRDGHLWHNAADGAIWRVYPYLDGITLETASDPALAGQAAHAFGAFARLMSNPLLALRETLPGFHDTRARLAALATAVDDDRAGRAGAARTEIDAILREDSLAARIPAGLESGALPLRVAHSDAKIANVRFETASATMPAVIDLDTVMPGTPLHDFGDLVRSMVSDAPEDAEDVSSVQVRHDYFVAIVRGFLAGIGDMLTGGERALLVTAARSIALEQAARFLTDHLNGDRYFHASVPGQNLRRARAQLALFQRLTADGDRLEALVAAA